MAFPCHVMPLISTSSCNVIALVSVSWNGDITISVPLHSLFPDDQNDVKHDYLGHVTPLGPALVSCDIHSVINGTIALLTSGQSKLGVT